MQFISPELVVCIFDCFFRMSCILFFWSWRRNCSANHDANRAADFSVNILSLRRCCYCELISSIKQTFL